MLDFFDPNNWSAEERAYRIYAGRTAEVECLVDEEDYLHFTGWMWAPLQNKNKIYLRRTQTLKEDGVRLGSASIYLHVEILTRAEGGPPTTKRCIADHWNGNELDCRRHNLRWATKRENNQNRFGIAHRQRSFHDRPV